MAGGLIHNNDLDAMEAIACRVPDSPDRCSIRRLVSEVRRLRHELEDPNFLYSSSRIHRQAILTREAEIAELRVRIAQLENGSP